MTEFRTQVYFALSGESFDPFEISKRLKVLPTESWKKGDRGKYNPSLKNSGWIYSSKIGSEYIEISKLINEFVRKFENNIEILIDLKNEFNLTSVLEIVLDIDINPSQTTPALFLDLKTIEFLSTTKTTFDVDIYRFSSEK
ncbi:MAG: DUF4279 domain-containing protein [Flavobacteriia bacterium]